MLFSGLCSHGTPKQVHVFWGTVQKVLWVFLVGQDLGAKSHEIMVTKMAAVLSQEKTKMFRFF